MKIQPIKKITLTTYLVLLFGVLTAQNTNSLNNKNKAEMLVFKSNFINQMGLANLINVASQKHDKAPTIIDNIKDTASFENDFFRILKNINSDEVTNPRVVVALSNVRIKSLGRDDFKITRGELMVFKPNEGCKIIKGEYIEVIVKQNHPALKGPEQWIEPIGNKIVYEDTLFRVFDEKLDPGATRSLHSHSQRVSVRLNQVHLTDPRFEISKIPGTGIQVANTFKYAEAMVHAVKNLSDIPLKNIIIEFKASPK